MYGYERAHCKLKGNGKAMKNEFFSCANQSGQWPAKTCKETIFIASSNYGNREDSDEEAKECFLQDTEIQQKWLQKDDVKEQAPKIA